MTERRYLLSRGWDFWLLGGFSLVIGPLFLLAEHFRGESPMVNGYFLRLPATFGILSLLCNYPHFLVSYKIGYGRGSAFIARNWFQLLVVPATLLALFITAFLLFDKSTPENILTSGLNSGLKALGADFYFGSKNSLGQELLITSVWFMYLTVGWHYSKQVFGCTAVYCKYEKYPLDPSQRRLLKTNLLSVALFNFIFLNTYAKNQKAALFGTPSGGSSIVFEFSAPYIWAAGVLLALTTLGVLAFIVLANWRRHRRLPGVTGAALWLSFFVWWLPVFPQPEFYIFAVPFFHSLQYLPFAYRVENSQVRTDRYRPAKDIARLAFLLAAGILAFDLVPERLDGMLDSAGKGLPAFFAIAATVFLNVHHFFIDNVSWRFNEPKVRIALLG